MIFRAGLCPKEHSGKLRGYANMVNGAVPALCLLRDSCQFSQFLRGLLSSRPTRAIEQDIHMLNGGYYCDDEHFASAHELEIVDLLDHPKRALADGIIVTPTLLKLLPLPVERVIGTLSDTHQVLRVLSGR